MQERTRALTMHAGTLLRSSPHVVTRALTMHACIFLHARKHALFKIMKCMHVFVFTHQNYEMHACICFHACMFFARTQTCFCENCDAIPYTPEGTATSWNPYATDQQVFYWWRYTYFDV
jgi:hypothetical protein